MTKAPSLTLFHSSLNELPTRSLRSARLRSFGGSGMDPLTTRLLIDNGLVGKLLKPRTISSTGERGFLHHDVFLIALFLVLENATGCALSLAPALSLFSLTTSPALPLLVQSCIQAVLATSHLFAARQDRLRLSVPQAHPSSLLHGLHPKPRTPQPTHRPHPLISSWHLEKTRSCSGG